MFIKRFVLLFCGKKKSLLKNIMKLKKIAYQKCCKKEVNSSKIGGRS